MLLVGLLLRPPLCSDLDTQDPSTEGENPYKELPTRESSIGILPDAQELETPENDYVPPGQDKMRNGASPREFAMQRQEKTNIDFAISLFLQGRVLVPDIVVDDSDEGT